MNHLNGTIVHKISDVLAEFNMDIRYLEHLPSLTYLYFISSGLSNLFLNLFGISNPSHYENIPKQHTAIFSRL